MIRLLSKGQLAEQLGRDPTYVSAMVRQGYKMQYGTRTTLRHALGWLKDNPTFRVSDAYPSMLSTRRGIRPGRRLVTAGK
jgi:hypothetical protein